MTDTGTAGLARAIDARLREAGDPARAESERRYLKSSLQHYGVRVPTTRTVVRLVLADAPPLGHDEVLALADELWQGDVFDRHRAAVTVLARHTPLLGPEDLDLVERLVRQSGTWALVDELAIAVAGPVLADHAGDPISAQTLQRWSRDEDFWVRRTALLAVLPQIRAMRVEPQPLTRDQAALLDQWRSFAAGMLEEREFFIRKAIGWVLRELSRRRPTWVRDWLERYGDRASGVTRREAVKYLPAD